MKKFWTDFKKFISKGNIMDLAVAVIIGAAFGKIVTSLVNDLLMPLISALFTLMGLKGFSEWKWVITQADAANNIAEVALNYGAFLQAILDFLIVAMCIFIIFRIISSATKRLGSVSKTILKKNKKGEVVETVVEVPVVKEPTTAELLIEIRELMKVQFPAAALAIDTAAVEKAEAEKKAAEEKQEKKA